jgi:hypothetical protein
MLTVISLNLEKNISGAITCPFYLGPKADGFRLTIEATYPSATLAPNL